MARSGAGRLRHVITVNTVAKARDGYGDSVDSTTDFASSIRADIVTLGSTQGGNDAVDGGAEFMITMRYRTGLTKQHTITWGDRTLDITGINTDDKHRGWMKIHARERDLD